MRTPKIGLVAALAVLLALMGCIVEPDHGRPDFHHGFHHY